MSSGPVIWKNTEKYSAQLEVVLYTSIGNAVAATRHATDDPRHVGRGPSFQAFRAGLMPEYT